MDQLNHDLNSLLKSLAAIANYQYEHDGEGLQAIIDAMTLIAEKAILQQN